MTGDRVLEFLDQGGRITFTRQVQNYQSTVSQLVNILGGEAAAADHLSKCIFVVGMGSNDYLNNYYMPQFYTSGRQYTPEQWADILIRLYVQQLRVSYFPKFRQFSTFKSSLGITQFFAWF